MVEQENRKVVEAMLQALEHGDLDTYETSLLENAVEEYPQSGERLRGRNNIMAVARNYPGFPKATRRRIVGSGEIWVVEATLDYSGKIYHLCEILELKNGKIAKMTSYFAEPFDAPGWRAKWVERM